ncbi:STAS domain protein [Caulifigura coniformis]|uniref:STAS domain protein n=1 Tax=Caulifigura coniformis TaxID=2527983 RepID=A0A517SHY3_9PLAN|nr:STAS domain-containing protein [Caulifigura coniformis]QDT55736.1 STAS domain protein [Caulifigura coniformis]
MESRFFKIAVDEDVARVDVLRDRLTEEDNIEEFGQELTSLVEKQKVTRIVLNMERVKYFTSSVIGKLIMLHRRMSRSDGQMVLANLPPEAEEILSTSQLLTYFNTSATDNGANSGVQA